MEKVLVIGGTGTMGQPLVDKLLAKNIETHVVCRHLPSDNRKHIVYHIGDYKNVDFIQSVLTPGYDSIVDFGYYESGDFKQRYETLLNATSHYVCLSSAAVYADDPEPKSEQSPRFMEVDPPIDGSNKSKLYCYEKARIEDAITQCGYKNWTIVRPGITINRNHFFWGSWIDELWISRILQGQSVVIPDDLLQYKVTLTYGGDVAEMIIKILSDKRSFCEIYNVTSTNVYSWGELLDVYKGIFKRLGHTVKEKHLKDSSAFMSPGFWEYQYKRIKLLDRRFDSRKIYELGGVVSTPVESLLETWCKDYMDQFPSFKIRRKYIEMIAKLDRITREITSYNQFRNMKDYIYYLTARFTPKVISVIYITRRMFKR